MRSFFKVVLTLMLLAGMAYAVNLTYETYFLGGIYRTGDLLVQIGEPVLCLIVLVILGWLIRLVWSRRYRQSVFNEGNNIGSALVLFLLMAGTISGCSYARANQHVIRTTDCGKSWTAIEVGESVPRNIGVCSYTQTIPAYAMQGTCKFRATFKGKVRANMEVDYDYLVVDPVAFATSAKYLGKSSEPGDESPTKNDSRAYEAAENMIIDRAIKDVCRDDLSNDDIVDFSPSDYEDSLLVKLNARLKTKGVQIQALSSVVDPTPQTSQAIDIVTAMRIYETSNLGDVGKASITARSGAPKVTVTVSDAKKEDEPTDE